MAEEYTKLDLKGNSDIQKSSPSREVNERRVQPIMGEEDATPRKKKKLLKNIFANDMKTAAKKVFSEILIPSAKDVMYDLGMGLLDNIFYDGKRGGSHRTLSGGRSDKSSIDYHRISSGRPSSRRPVSNDVFELDDIFVKGFDKAEKILDALDNLIDTTGYATVGDLYDTLSWPCQYTCNDYGWTRLGRDARIVTVRDGYVVELPEPTYIADIIRRQRR